MPVERVDYSSDDEYQQALRQEEEYYQSQNQINQEPNVIPCAGCGYQMYEENQEPKYNFCKNCKDIINGIKQVSDNTGNDLPF